MRESIAAIRLLLGAGAEVDATDASGRTPLHLAAATHDLPGGIAALLRAGASPNRRDHEGNSPLHSALGPDLGWPGTVSMLLDGGADPSQSNDAGLTALQLYVQEGRDEGRTAKLLIDAGADPDRKYPNGDTSLHAAIRNGGGKAAVTEALLAGGADPCVRNSGGLLPYQLAPQGGAIHRALSSSGGDERACAAEPDPEEDPGAGADQMMRAKTRSNVRSGPGTEHGKVGLLEVGDVVRVTGQVGDWFRIELSDGGTAFVYGPLLEELAEEAPVAPPGTDWSVAENQPCEVWNYGYPSLEPFTWSGACVGGKASGSGRLTINDGRIVYDGTLRDGRMHGSGETVHVDGSRYQGQFRNGHPHGFGTKTYANGDSYEGEFRAGKRHGRGTYTRSEGGAETCEWSDDEQIAGSCLTVTPGRRPTGPGGGVDPVIPDAITRLRVADWMDRCDHLWTRELLPRTSVRFYDLHDDREARAFLEALEAYGGPVDAAREYIGACVPVFAELRRGGLDRRCDRLEREIDRRIGKLSTVLREADSLLGRRGLPDRSPRRTLEDYLQTCVPAIAAAMDGSGDERFRPYDPERAALRARLRQGDWLFPGTVASLVVRNRMIRALGRDLVSGPGRSDSRLLLQAISKNDPLTFRLVRPPPYEYADMNVAPLVSQWGNWSVSTYVGGHSQGPVRGLSGNRFTQARRLDRCPACHRDPAEWRVRNYPNNGQFAPHGVFGRSGFRASLSARIRCWRRGSRGFRLSPLPDIPAGRKMDGRCAGVQDRRRFRDSGSWDRHPDRLFHCLAVSRHAVRSRYRMEQR